MTPVVSSPTFATRSRPASHSRRPRVLYLSSLPARNSTSGALLIHRHLTRAAANFDLVHAHDDPVLAENAQNHRVPLRPAIQRLQNTRWFPFVWSLRHGIGGAVAARALDRLCERVQPDVVLTVAEGPLVPAVHALARRRRLPLVTFFHDWASNWLPASGWVKALADRQLRALYDRSDVALCISPALRDAFGPHRNAWVLPPIPDATSLHTVDTPGAPFHAVYAGVMHHLYRDELEGLAVTLARHRETSLLRVHAPTPPPDGPFVDGPAEIRSMYGGFLKGSAFETALAAASAFLVISPFGATWRKIARLSFPSKIPEYCRFGKPLVVWGPADSAAVEWAARSGAALVVTDPAPEAAAAALRCLYQDAGLRAGLAAAASRCAARTFAPDRLQHVFETGIWHALGKAARPPAADIT